MKKKFRKVIAAILTVTMTMSIAMPALANTDIVERASENKIINSALESASEAEKAKITEALFYMDKDTTLSMGQLVAIEKSAARTNENNAFSYIIDYGKYEETITFLDISDDVVSYVVTRGDISNTITKYSDGRFLLNNHGIEISKVDPETQSLVSCNTATNEVIVTTDRATTSTRAVDINYWLTCPYQTTREYTFEAGGWDQPNVALYETFMHITFTAFTDIIILLYPAYTGFVRIIEIIYDFIDATSPQTEGLSYYEDIYFHESCDSVMSNGYIDALGYSVEKIVTIWFAQTYYQGDWHGQTIYKTYERW